MSSERHPLRPFIGATLVACLAVVGLACAAPQPPAAYCPVGQFSATGYAPCQPAPAGSFVNTVGAIAPTLCSLGKYQPLLEAVSCFLAPTGFYVDTAGAVAATPAPLGFYVDTVGAIAATACPPLTTTLFTASTALSDCV